MNPCAIFARNDPLCAEYRAIHTFVEFFQDFFDFSFCVLARSFNTPACKHFIRMMMVMIVVMSATARAFVVIMVMMFVFMIVTAAAFVIIVVMMFMFMIMTAAAFVFFMMMMLMFNFF